ncbi:hypothetical protein RhiirA4_463557 [Rhizophagus irregularis]|uniref:Uncharacterized protein n=1 Tax=Rhizophagus irregularis TaxID=588596 RepID=A0A2I1GN76_9GLOM|nr:hypothetical protein RhiirA4_463557 [Rhizophagus irregularis]
MDLLFGEFIGDRVVDGRYELFWGLVNSLLTAFDLPNPTSLPLFQNCKELTENGYAKLFSCYSKGEERLVQIYRQEEEGLVATKTKNIKIAERTSKKYPPQSEAGLPQDLRNHGIDEALDALLKLSADYWTKRKVKAAWRYVQKKRQTPS